MFRLFGFNIQIHPSFFFMAAVLGMPSGSSTDEVKRLLIWIAVVFVSILVHELGHAFAVRGQGGEASIELYSLGGLTHHEHQGRLTNAQNAWISFAGPLAGFALGGLAYLIGAVQAVGNNALLHELQRQLLWVNIAWGLLNLLPMLPLDGGHIMQSALNALTRGKGDRPALYVSMAVGLGCVALAITFKLYWAGFIAGWCMVGSVQSLLRQRKTRDDSPLWQEFEQVSQNDESDGQMVRAQLEQLLDRARSDQLRAGIVQELAWLHLDQEREELAVKTLSRMPAGYSPDEALQAVLLFNQGRHADAIPCLLKALEQRNSEGEKWEWGVDALCQAYEATGQPEQARELRAKTAERERS